jgi:hypothetical protein
LVRAALGVAWFRDWAIRDCTDWRINLMASLFKIRWAPLHEAAQMLRAKHISAGSIDEIRQISPACRVVDLADRRARRLRTDSGMICNSRKSFACAFAGLRAVADAWCCTISDSYSVAQNCAVLQPLSKGEKPGLHHYCYSIANYDPADAVATRPVAG